MVTVSQTGKNDKKDRIRHSDAISLIITRINERIIS